MTPPEFSLPFQLDCLLVLSPFLNDHRVIIRNQGAFSLERHQSHLLQSTYCTCAEILTTEFLHTEQTFYTEQEGKKQE